MGTYSEDCKPGPAWAGSPPLLLQNLSPSRSPLEDGAHSDSPPPALEVTCSSGTLSPIPAKDRSDRAFSN